MLKKLNKIANCLIIILVIVNIYMCCIGIAFHRDVNVPVVFPTQSQYNVALEILDNELRELNKSKKELRKFICNDFNLRMYFYKEKSMKDYSGKTYATIRLIVMDPDVFDYEYAQVFAHEVIHLKNLISNDSWVCFETFKYLYEHEELHNVGVWYGQKQLQGCYGGEYNIADLIVNYLTNK